MIFNSITFLIFFIIFFTLYWILNKEHLKKQNLILLLGSYFFYAWVDWRLLIYLVGVSVFNFLLGLSIEKSKSESKKKIYVYLGVLQGLGGLFFFKYFNFFIESFNDAFQLINLNFNLQTLNIIVPLGISFFTFKTISYILDINKGKIKPTKDWLIFFNYIAFFPTLLAGPIDASKSFIPQLEKTRKFNYYKSIDGLRQILWGLFKKVVIADNIATITNPLFDNIGEPFGSTLLIGAFLYTIQIYADFSGYSDMAIGFARLIGFNVTKNFDFPFFAQNIAEFWRKWHISLTIWLTEYVFTPLSIYFRDYGRNGLIFAIILNFTLIGIWHGANFTYVLFGFLHGCYFVPLLIKGTMNKRKVIDPDKLLPTFREVLNIAGTFTLVMFTFIIFRAATIHQAYLYITKIFSKSLFTIPDFGDNRFVFVIFMLILFFITIEWIGKSHNFAIEKLGLTKPAYIRRLFYYLILVLLFWFGGSNQEFIYFQF